MEERERKLSDFEEIVEEMAELEPEETVWTIENDEIADWALRKIREMEDECNRLNETRKKIIETYLDAIREEEEKTERRTEHLRWHLRRYFQQVPHKATKTQESYRLPSGSLVMKQLPPQYERDDETVTEWLRNEEMDSYLDTRTSIRWADLKRCTTALPDGSVVYNTTGEMIPGLRTVTREPVFMIK